METIKIDFRKWRQADADALLGIQLLDEDAELNEWLGVSGKLAPEYLEELRALAGELKKKESSWNEFDLIANFIGPFLRLLKFSGKRYSNFFHRPLQASFEVGEKKYEASGFVDWVVASGIAEPVRPYFFLTEYKRQSMGKSDPLGQALIAMLAAQQQNADGRPIYGCYVIGSSWRFIRLFEKFYSVSATYDASSEAGITQIWLVLQKTKRWIEEWVNEK